MKFNKVLSFVIITTILLNITACNYEPIDPNVNLYSAENPIAVPPNANIPVINNPSNDYFPLEVNNFWNYDNGTEIINYKLLSTDTYDSKLYYKANKAWVGYDSMMFKDSDITSHVLKDGVNYIQRIFINRAEVIAKPANGSIPEVIGVSGIIIQPYFMTFLKDDLQVGASFNQTIPLAITTKTTTTQIINSAPTVVVSNINSTANLTFEITLVEKTPNIFVNGYLTTVLKTKTTSSSSTDIIYTWYAKDIGIWKQTRTNATGVVSNFLNLTAFSVL